MTAEKVRVGGKATTSTKGKAPAKKATKDVPSTSTQADELTSPEESEIESVNLSANEESDAEDQGASTSSCTARPKRAFGCVPAHPRTEHVCLLLKCR